MTHHTHDTQTFWESNVCRYIEWRTRLCWTCILYLVTHNFIERVHASVLDRLCDIQILCIFIPIPPLACVCTCVGLWAACGDTSKPPPYEIAPITKCSCSPPLAPAYLWYLEPETGDQSCQCQHQWSMVTVVLWTSGALEQGHRYLGRRWRGADRGHKLQSYKTLMDFVWGGHGPRVLVLSFPSHGAP